MVDDWWVVFATILNSPLLARMVARVEQERTREAELVRLEGRIAALEREVVGLRSSMSWRVTAPLRAVYGWWLRRVGRADG